MVERLYKSGELTDPSTGKPEDIIRKGMYSRLFSDRIQLSPNLSEVYELVLAYYESKILNEKEVLKNSAYIIRVNQAFTNHYYLCTGEPVKIPDYSSSRLKTFFINNQFRTGYSTHGLFPYRGKFHPQMIKALMNIMGLKPGETVLDPMMGSGTVPVEASLMGIKSIGIDASPFCRFMAQTKCDALNISPAFLNKILERVENIFQHFNTCNKTLRGQAGRFHENGFIEMAGDEKLFNLIFLAFLDSEGYAQRSRKKSHLDYFRSILDRYIVAVRKIITVKNNLEIESAPAILMEGDARKTGVESDSIDGIVFSPPYSFAIDYLKNDFTHLAYFESDECVLRQNMIGLRGMSLKEKYELYLADMDEVMSECFRVMKPGRFCTIIVGTNDSQLSKVLNIPRNEVSGLHEMIKMMGIAKGFSHIRSLPRQIVGMANVMRQEYVVILQKPINTVS